MICCCLNISIFFSQAENAWCWMPSIEMYNCLRYEVGTSWSWLHAAKIDLLNFSLSKFCMKWISRETSLSVCVSVGEWGILKGNTHSLSLSYFPWNWMEAKKCKVLEIWLYNVKKDIYMHFLPSWGLIPCMNTTHTCE